MNASPPPVRVIVPTTGGPAEIIYLGREDAVVGQSMVCIDGTTQQAGIDREYNAFVRRPSGLIEELYGHGTFRMDVDGPIDVGSSWQLGTFIAHALEAEGRLLQRLDMPDSREGLLVWATGAVRTVDMAVGEVGHVADKVRLSLDLFQKAVSGGVESMLLVPAGNLADIDPESGSRLAALGVRVEAIRNLSDALGLFHLSVPDRHKPIHPHQAADAEMPSLPQWTGNPYPGLQAFGRAERTVFFGRGRAREECLELLRRAAARGRPFLLVHGKSGAGKSSLAMAGIADDIATHAHEGGEWRIVVTRLTGGDTEPTQAVASAIAETFALKGSIRREFIRSFADDPSAALAAHCATAAGGERTTKTLLVLDQLEQALVGEETDGSAARFGKVLEQLCIGGNAWIVATMRTDQLDLLERAPALSRLAADERLYRLQPPSLFELSEIITQPALLAGLSFGEEDTGLPDELAEMALRSPDSLPLLQFVLSRLAELAGPERVLSRTVLDRIGGFDGAVVTCAEEAVSELAAQGYTGAEVDRVLGAFVRSDETGEHFLSREVAIQDTGDPTDRRRHILDHLVATRLVVADSRENVFSAKLAHESLVRTWPRLAELVNRHAGNIVLRDRLEAGTREWMAGDRDDSLVLRGETRILAAEELCADERFELGTDVAGFVIRSQEVHEAERQRKEEEQAARLQAAAEKERLAKRLMRRTLIGVTVCLALVVLATGLGYGAFSQFQRALASERLGFALRALNEAEQNPVAATKLALAAAQIGSSDIRSETVLRRALDVALAQPRTLAFLSGHRDRINDVAFSPENHRVVTGSDDRTARLWDGRTGALLAEFMHEERVVSVAFSQESGNVISASIDGTVKVWNHSLSHEPTSSFSVNEIQQANPLSYGVEDWFEVVYTNGEADILDAEALESERPQSMILSRSGSHLLTVNGVNDAVVWQISKGAPVSRFTLGQSFPDRIAFSPDGQLVASGMDELEIIDTDSGKVLRKIESTDLLDWRMGGISWHGLTFADNWSLVLWLSNGRLARIGLPPFDETTDPTAPVPGMSFEDAHFEMKESLRAFQIADNTIAMLEEGGELHLGNSFINLGNAFNSTMHRSIDNPNISGVFLSDDGRRVAIALDDGRVRIDQTRFESEGQVEVSEAAAGAEKIVAYSPDGQHMITTGDDGDFDIRVMTTGRSLLHIPTPGGSLVDARFDRTGETLTVAWNKNETSSIIHRYSKVDEVWQSLDEFEIGGKRWGALVLSPDGTHFAVKRFSSTPPRFFAEIHPTDNPGTKSHTLHLMEDDVEIVAISPDAGQIVTRGTFAGIRMRDTSNPSQAINLADIRSPGYVSFTPDGRFLLVADAGLSDRVIAYDSDRFAVVGSLMPKYSLSRFDVSADGRRIMWPVLGRRMMVWQPDFPRHDLIGRACRSLPFIRGKRDLEVRLSSDRSAENTIDTIHLCERSAQDM